MLATLSGATVGGSGEADAKIGVVKADEAVVEHGEAKKAVEAKEVEAKEVEAKEPLKLTLDKPKVSMPLLTANGTNVAEKLAALRTAGVAGAPLLAALAKMGNIGIHTSMAQANVPSVSESIQDELKPAMEKSGVELFKELKRLYAAVEIDDYFKSGVWKEQLMKMDIQLLYTHRLEAGAPDPPKLEDVVVPDMPKSAQTTAQSVFAAMAAHNSGLIAMPGGGAHGSTTIPLKGVSQILKPSPLNNIVKPGEAVSAGAAALAAAAKSLAAAKGGDAGAPGNAIAEMRLIALFVAKWKLEPMRTKSLLTNLTSARRRFVCQQFKTTSTGDMATSELERFIQQSDAPDLGEKRPLGLGALSQATDAKKPKVELKLALNPLGGLQGPGMAKLGGGIGLPRI